MQITIAEALDQRVNTEFKPQETRDVYSVRCFTPSMSFS